MDFRRFLSVWKPEMMIITHSETVLLLSNMLFLLFATCYFLSKAFFETSGSMGHLNSPVADFLVSSQLSLLLKNENLKERTLWQQLFTWPMKKPISRLNKTSK